MQLSDEYIFDALSGIYSREEIRVFIRYMLEDVCNVSFSGVSACKFNNLSDAQARKIKDIVERLRRREPIQYILGKTEFYGLPFIVAPGVLIPRPETEELVEWIVAENKLESPKILDIGCGSGCISVTLAKKIPGAEVHAWDVSPTALELTRKNAALNNTKVHTSQTDVLKLNACGTVFDVIVSNPPYVLETEKAEMEKNVLDFEPHIALFVPDTNPLLFYDKIADLALTNLSPHGKLYFEVNREKGHDVKEMLQKKGFTNAELKKDISGNNRMVRAEKPM